jgi:hypothetical protein
LERPLSETRIVSQRSRSNVMVPTAFGRLGLDVPQSILLRADEVIE